MNPEFGALLTDLLKSLDNTKWFSKKTDSIAKYINNNERLNDLFQFGLRIYSRGYYDQSIIIWEVVLKYSQQRRNEKMMTSCCNYIGRAYEKLDQYIIAINYFNRALDIARRIVDIENIIASHTGLGKNFHRLGDYQKAIDHFSLVRDIAKENGDKDEELNCILDIGSIYDSLGQYQNAIDHFNHVLEIAKDIHEDELQFLCYGSLGHTYVMVNSREAIEYFNHALDIARSIYNVDLSGQAASCFAGLGNAYHGLKRHITAIYNYQRALEIAKRINDDKIQAECFVNLGLCNSEIGEDQKAIDYYQQALRIVKRIGHVDTQSIIYKNMAISYLKRKLIRDAYANSKLAVDLRDSLALKIVEEHYKLSFFETSAFYYNDFINMSFELANRVRKKKFTDRDTQKINDKSDTAKIAEEVFYYIEKSKSRAFLELLSSTEIIKPSDILERKHSKLLKEEKKLRLRLSEIQLRHLKSSDEDIVSTGIRTKPLYTLREKRNIISESESPQNVKSVVLQEIQEGLDKIYDTLNKTDSHYVDLRRGQPLSLGATQNILLSQTHLQNQNNLAPNSNLILVEYYATLEKLFIFVVTSSSFHVEPIDVSYKKIYAGYEGYYREEVARRKQDIGSVAVHTLSEYLIDPISEYLTNSEINSVNHKNEKTICFVPHNILHHIPLHALQLDGDYLIKKYPIFYLPSASMLQFYRKIRPNRLSKCSAFALDKGQEKFLFKDEAKEVAKMFGTNPFIDPDEDTVKENLNADVLHFATHASFDTVSPLNSSLKLVNNKKISAKEIFGDMRLDSDLVTLSACGTGLSKVRQGDELLGLTRAFIYAGSPSVLVSLWSVSDTSTKELMVNFYDNLKNKEMSKVKALQQAQLNLMKVDSYSDPYYWAPFILVGDWR